MIKKIIFKLILILFFLVVGLIITLSTIGIETNRFNKVISSKIAQEKNIQLKLKTINFKLDPKELSLFIETVKPEIVYFNLSLPTQSVKVYVDFLTLFKMDFKIKKIHLKLDELNIAELNLLSKFIKPSNIKSIVNNKIIEGRFISELEIYLSNEGRLDQYIIRGNVKDLKAKLTSDLNLSKTSFNFIADKEDILFKNIFGNMESIKISEGDMKINIESGLKINSNFISEITLDNKIIKKLSNVLSNYQFMKNVESFNGIFNNNFSMNFDNTYKLKEYKYKFSGKINESKIKLSKPFKNSLISEEIKSLYLSDTQLASNLSPQNFKMSGEGKYSFNKLDYLKFNCENNSRMNDINLNLNFDYSNSLDFKLINYTKPKNKVANFSLNLNKQKDSIKIKNLEFKEKNNFIKFYGLNFEKDNFISLKKIDVQTPNNNFFIQWDKKILIEGSKFDATNLPKYFSNQSNGKKFQSINRKIEINFKKIKAPLSEELKNFRLIGEIQKGKFVKISSKGDFGGNNFLDISLKKDKNSEKKFLEIYSDLTRPLLTEYNFFNGLSGGKLNFTSLIDGSKSNSKLVVENFKVVNAPGLIKLLSLADLGGLADLAEGDGLSFDLLEIDMEKNKNILKLNEILALGPSISVLMEGYQGQDGLTSLKGTLVPAKTLNKIISKIPIIGNIVIPKEVGEGLFGISFKMKGPKGKMKTTINPIRTLTPRFIQKIIDKNKNSK